MRKLSLAMFAFALSGCAAFLEVGPQCENMEMIYFTTPPVSPGELEQIKADGFDACAGYLEDAGLVAPGDD